MTDPGVHDADLGVHDADPGVHDADPGVHDADLAVHDGPIRAFTMDRFSHLDTAPARGAKSPLEPARGSRALHSPTAASARQRPNELALATATADAAEVAELRTGPTRSS